MDTRLSVLFALALSACTVVVSGTGLTGYRLQCPDASYTRCEKLEPIVFHVRQVLAHEYNRDIAETSESMRNASD